MAETRQKRTFESQISLKPAGLKVAPSKTPSLEEMTPARYSKLTAHQRKELMLKLIEFLKSF
jgi:hypothetical protein